MIPRGPTQIIRNQKPATCRRNFNRKSTANNGRDTRNIPTSPVGESNWLDSRLRVEIAYKKKLEKKIKKKKLEKRGVLFSSPFAAEIPVELIFTRGSRNSRTTAGAN